MFFKWKKRKAQAPTNTLYGVKPGSDHLIKAIRQEDQAVAHFLNTLGCIEGETITLVSILSDTYVIAIKGARYSIDAELAKSIIIS